jgi:fatty-acyl-CoA synthase
MDLSDWIKCHADTIPDKPAILFEGREISYARLARRIERCARVLVHGLGVKPGDRIAYLGQNSPEQIALLFACARVGAILLPLNWRLAAPEHVQLLQHARPRAMFVDGLFTDHVNGVREQLDFIKLVSYASEGEGWNSFIELEDARRGQPVVAEPVGLDEDDGLLLCYTSGTTGIPKGALLSKKALTCNAANSVDMHAMTADDIVLTVLPMFHVGGLNIQTIPALFAGATVVLLRQFDVDQFYQALDDHPVTLTLIVPTIMLLLMADARWTKGKPASLRIISIGSTVVPESMVSKVCNWGVPLVQVYGSTETCPIAAYTSPEDAARKPASTGKTAKHCEVRIVDETGKELAQGESGEILVRGSNVMTKYWHDADATHEVFTNGWLHTGDIGHFDDEGFLYVDGRLKDMIISGGENIYPALIENVLSECDDIEEVAVVGRPDDHWGEVAVAVVVVKEGSMVNAEKIINFCSGRISRFSCPKEAVRVDSLPRNAMGKVLKEEVRQMVVAKSKEQGSE